MKLKHVNPKRLKILIAVFTIVGIWGVAFGLFAGAQKASMNYFTIVLLGVINIGLAAFFVYILLIQQGKRDPRKDSKYKRKK